MKPVLSRHPRAITLWWMGEGGAKNKVNFENMVITCLILLKLI
jgi:hypothetical protein